MKKIWIALSLLSLTFPAWADDELKPEPLDQAIKEFVDFCKTDTPDPMNHVVWKLYVFAQLTPNGGLNRSTQRVLTGLTSNPKKNYFVIVGLNQLWNSLSSLPKQGDVIVVDGRVLSHFKSHLQSGDQYPILNTLVLYPQNAKYLPEEHFQITQPQSPSNPNLAPSIVASPRPQVILTPEPMEQALQEYKNYWQSSKINLNNHISWKLYVREQIHRSNGPADRVLGSLTSDPKGKYFVVLDMDQVSSLINPTPDKGDVIVVDGMVTDKQTLHVTRDDPATGEKYHFLRDAVNVFPTQAMKLIGEHYEPPLVENSTPTTELTPVPQVDPMPTTQIRPYIPDKGQR
jgi:hypothetical protein